MTKRNMPSRLAAMRRLVLPLATVAVVLALAVTAVLVLTETSKTHATAYFTETKSLYVGDDVQVLGVRVGEVTAITPERGRVRVDMQWDGDRAVPKSAKAILAAPTLVSVRHVQLTPVYAGGPRLQDGDTIPISRTGVPVEWDQIKRQVTDFSRALGPNGANADGAVSRALETTAANMRGRGTDLNHTMQAMSEAMSTLADGSGDFFGTVRNLQVFTDALNSSDAQVREFTSRLRGVSDYLASDRRAYGDAFASLDRAFGAVNEFMRTNRGQIRDTVRDAQPLADMLADTRQGLADALQWAPHVVSNLNNMYDPVSGSLTGQLSFSNFQAPGNLVCNMVFNLGGPPEMCNESLRQMTKLVTLPPLPAGINPLERNGAANQVVSQPGPNPRYNGHNDPNQPDDPGVVHPPITVQTRDGLPGLMLPGGGR